MTFTYRAVHFRVSSVSYWDIKRVSTCTAEVQVDVTLINRLTIYVNYTIVVGLYQRLNQTKELPATWFVVVSEIKSDKPGNGR